MKRFAIVFAMAAMLLLLVPIAAAQTTPTPTIVRFAASIDEISVADAEAGETDVTLEWTAINVAAQQRLELSQYRFDAWEIIEAPAPLALSGEFTTTVQHTLDFSPVTYRLVIVDSQGQVRDAHVLTLAYAPCDTEEDCEPEISTFETDTEQVEAAALVRGEARVVVTWEIDDRPPFSNLRFEQILPDGRTINVELPRAALWIGSEGTGPVAPVLPPDGEDVVIRLQLVDLTTQDVYAEAEIEVPVLGSVNTTGG